MATDREQIRSYVEAETKQRFTKICKKENRSESNMVEFLILQFLEDYEAKEAKEQERTELKGKLSDSMIG